MDRYRLGPLRDVRAREERTKRNDLAVAVGDARATSDDVSAARAREARAREVLAAAVSARAALLASTVAGDVARAERYIARCRHALDHTLTEHARARATHAGKLGAIDAARERLTTARADKEVIERHFARWRDTQKKLAERREDG